MSSKGSRKLPLWLQAPRPCGTPKKGYTVTGGAVTGGRKGGRHKKSSPTPRGLAQGVSNHINGAMPHVKASGGGITELMPSFRLRARGINGNRGRKKQPEYAFYTQGVCLSVAQPYPVHHYGRAAVSVRQGLPYGVSFLAP